MTKKKQADSVCPSLVQHKSTGERFFVYAGLQDGKSKIAWRYLCVRAIEANGYAPVVISINAQDVDDISHELAHALQAKDGSSSASDTPT